MAAVPTCAAGGETLVKGKPQPYILAYDSDADEEDAVVDSAPGVVGNPDVDHGGPTTTPTHSRLSAEDSQSGESAAHASTPMSAAHPRTSSPDRPPLSLRSLPQLTLSAVAAEKLLHVSETAETERERAAALAQLARFRGAYRALCRGAPFSVWVRYEEECASVVQETADFFRYELEQLIAARHARRRCHRTPGGSDEDITGGRSLREGIVSVESYGRRFIGCRSSLALLRGPGVCSGGAAVEQAEEAEALAQLPHGDRVLMRLLALDDDGDGRWMAAGAGVGAGGAVASSTFCDTPLGSSIFEDALSPLAIYSEDAARTPRSGAQDTITSAARSKRGRAPGDDGKDGVQRLATFRRLDFDMPVSSVSSGLTPLFSLSEAAVEQRNHRMMQEWLRSSQNALFIPY